MKKKNKIKGSCLFNFFFIGSDSTFSGLGRRKGGVALNKVNNADLGTTNLTLNRTTQ